MCLLSRIQLLQFVILLESLPVTEEKPGDQVRPGAEEPRWNSLMDPQNAELIRLMPKHGEVLEGSEDKDEPKDPVYSNSFELPVAILWSQLLGRVWESI